MMALGWYIGTLTIVVVWVAFLASWLWRVQHAQIQRDDEFRRVLVALLHSQKPDWPPVRNFWAPPSKTIISMKDMRRWH